MRIEASLLYAFYMMIFLVMPTLSWANETRAKVLHLTFHRGCASEFAAVAHELAFDLETWFIPDLPPGSFDGVSSGNALYNIGQVRAENIWNLHKSYFETFDAIIVSDTAPLSRIFLQNDWKKPLIIWVCNRFDYSDTASLDCDFPDPLYYQLFKEACSKNNVKVIAYTEFEHYYAKSKGIETGGLTITPGVALNDAALNQPSIPDWVKKEEAFFLPPYLNESVFIDLPNLCNKLGIDCYRGRYSSASELSSFKGIIHLPYAWSNLAFFENIGLGIPYFIPSYSFLRELVSSGNYFHTNTSCLLENEGDALSEWYCKEHADFIVYFDSWEDLRKKIDSTDFLALREKIKNYAVLNRSTMINRWKNVFENVL